MCELKHCKFCGFSICAGQRWVRQKIYNSGRDGRDAVYHHYHAEPFSGQADSWEKHQIEQEMARTAA